MKYTALKKHLATGPVYAAYMPVGSDRYLITHSKKLLTDLVELPELNVNTFEGNADPYDVVKACTIMPMMGRYRLVVYEGFKSLDPAIVRYLQQPAPDSILCLIPSNNATGVVEAIKKFECAEIVECDHLDRALLAGWIRKEGGDRIEASAAELLIDYTASDLTRIDTELKKLIGFAGDRMVTADDVRDMVNRDAQYKIYELTQAVVAGRADDAYEMTERMLREIDALAIVKSLSNVYHRLLHVRISRVSDGELCASFGVKPGALVHLRAQAKRYSPLRLRATYEYILDSEHRVKSGRLTSRAALDNILLKIFASNAQ